MKVIYNNILYNHQRFWALVRALNKDDFVVEIKCGLPDAEPSYRYEANLDSAKHHDFAFGKSPFEALANCVCSLKITNNQLVKKGRKMKKVMLILVLCAMVVLAGCVNASYRDRTYAMNGNGKPVLMHEVKLDYWALNVKTQTKGVKLKLPNNVEVVVDERVQIPDPNSAIAEGQAVSNVLSGGTSGLVEKVVK